MAHQRQLAVAVAAYYQQRPLVVHHVHCDNFVPFFEGNSLHAARGPLARSHLRRPESDRHSLARHQDDVLVGARQVHCDEFVTGFHVERVQAAPVDVSQQRQMHAFNLALPRGQDEVGVFQEAVCRQYGLYMLTGLDVDQILYRSTACISRLLRRQFEHA